MIRLIDQYLLDWKNRPERLVLLLRGARQVGKTFSIRNLGSTFRYFLEINFEERMIARSFFEGDLVAGELCEKLAAYFGVPIVPGETLLFFDEIQACPNCLRSLRFFHEKMPGLHVAAAGSLLEFALAEIPSFGVGRIQSLFMFGLSLEEFLIAEGSGNLWEYARQRAMESPIEHAMHTRLLDKMRTYMMVGGMPAVVDAYCQNRDIRQCQEKISSLLATLYDDFSKYAARIDPLVLRDAFRSSGIQAGRKFKYSAIGSDIPGRQAKIALDLLVRAGIMHQIWHTDARGIPLGASKDHRRFKAIPMDIGIHQRMLGLDLSEVLVADYSSLVHRGHLAEVFAGQQFLMSSSPLMEPELFYWHRESRDTKAEVDYVIQQRDHIIPIEIKSGMRGTMQSMRIFLQEHDAPYGIRLSQENTSHYENIKSLPLYMAGALMRDTSKHMKT